MHKHGKTSAGSQRWFCPVCGLSATRKNPAAQQRQWRRAFKRWLVDKRKLQDLAKELRVTRNTLYRRFCVFLRDIPAAMIPKTAADCLSLDAFWFHGKNRNLGVLLVASVGAKPVYFGFAFREDYLSWKEVLAALPKPHMVVTDGNTGLCRALAELWADVPHQRCLNHISYETGKKLHSCRNTEAGRELNALREEMLLVATIAQAHDWELRFKDWEARNREALSQREEVIRHGRRYLGKYTNKSLRAGYAHLKKALPFMFVYLHHKNGQRTTSALEGGINAALRDIPRRHRGMPLARLKAAIAHFLLFKCE